MSIAAPTDISNCDAWFDASAAGDFSFSSGVIISQWNDRSGNGHHLTGISGGTMPSRTGTQNGLSVVAFNSGDNAPGTAGWSPSAQPFTIFIVTKVTSSTWGGIVGGGGGPQGIRRQGDNTIGFDYGAAASYAMDNTNYHVIVGVFNGASSQQRIDSVQVGTANTGTSSPPVFALGRDNDGNEMSGFFAETGIYSKALNSTELTDLEAYLTAKWFGGAPTKAPPPTQRRTQRALMRRAA